MLQVASSSDLLPLLATVTQAVTCPSTPTVIRTTELPDSLARNAAAG
jgi:hypothetical protein